MTEKHLSSQFDMELSGISTRVLEMGGLVESQVALAIYALTHFSGETASQVLEAEERVNQMEVDIDADLSAIIARRQPTARDLRLLIAISKTIGNLERVGDEAARIVGLDRLREQCVERERLVITPRQQAFEYVAAKILRRQSFDDERVEAVEAAELGHHQPGGEIGLGPGAGAASDRGGGFRGHGDPG